MSNAFLCKHHILSGKKNARNTSLAVYLLARDCQKYLTKTLRNLQRIGSYFKHVEFFVAENDSVDATTDILLRWCHEDSNHRHSVDVRTYVAQHIPLYTSHDDEGHNQSSVFTREHDASLEHTHMRKRTMRIAAVRDSALYAIKNSQTEFEYVLMLDADVFSFSVRGILSCFSDYFPPWDVLTANGRLFYFYMLKKFIPFLKEVYYDTFAIQRIHEDARPFDRNINLLREFSLLKKRSMLFPVNSAFGGMGLYKYHVLKDVEYFTSVEEDKFRFCEHISFHRKLRTMGFCNIFVNPAMLLHYNNASRAFFSGFVKHFFGMTVHKIIKMYFQNKNRIKV